MQELLLHSQGSRGTGFPLVPSATSQEDRAASGQAVRLGKMVFQGWVHFLQIEMVLKINKRLLRLFLQLKIIWGLGVLNNFNAFFHPCFPCFINGRWQETGAANIFLFRMQDLGRGDGGKLGISYLCCFLGFCFMSPQKKQGEEE